MGVLTPSATGPGNSWQGRTLSMLELMPGLTTAERRWVVNTAAVKREHGALLKAFRYLQMSFRKHCQKVLQRSPLSGVTVSEKNLHRPTRLCQERYSQYVSSTSNNNSIFWISVFPNFPFILPLETGRDEKLNKGRCSLDRIFFFWLRSPSHI